jgi:hypothetical protein
MQERERGIPVEPVYEMEESCTESPRAMDRLEQPMKEKQTKQDILREYEVAFSFLHSGCTIRIGCKHIAFTTVKEAMTAFNEYVNDPETAHAKWFKKFNEE